MRRTYHRRRGPLQPETQMWSCQGGGIRSRGKGLRVGRRRDPPRPSPAPTRKGRSLSCALTLALSGTANVLFGSEPIIPPINSSRHEYHHTPLQRVVRLPCASGSRSRLSPLAPRFPMQLPLIEGRRKRSNDFCIWPPRQRQSLMPWLDELALTLDRAPPRSGPARQARLRGTLCSLMR